MAPGATSIATTKVTPTAFSDATMVKLSSVRNP